MTSAIYAVARQCVFDYLLIRTWINPRVQPLLQFSLEPCQPLFTCWARRAFERRTHVIKNGGFWRRIHVNKLALPHSAVEQRRVWFLQPLIRLQCWRSNATNLGMSMPISLFNIPVRHEVCIRHFNRFYQSVHSPKVQENIGIGQCELRSFQSITSITAP